MPELPEVEVLRLGLVRKILGSQILEVKVLKPKLIAGYGTKRIASQAKTQSFLTSLKNKKIAKITRIAKNLVFTLNSESLILVHLKMTGQLVFVDKKNQRTVGGHPILSSYTENLPNKHTGLIFTLNNGTLYYNDVRMFGYVLYYKNLAEAKKRGHFKDLGLEPLDKNFTLDYFTEALKKKNQSLKAVLLDQSVVTGCGNIYSDEVCFASGIRPGRKANQLTKRETSKLYQSIQRILKKAIRYGGTSISDYLNAEGKKGGFAKFLKVYGRAGEKCLVCGTLLKKTKLSGRTSVYCPLCQK